MIDINYFMNQIDFQKILYASVVFLIFVFLRYLISVIIFPWIKKLLDKTKTEVDNEIFSIIESPLRFILIVFGLFFSFQIFISNPSIENILIKLLKTLIIFTFCWTLIRTEFVFERILKKFFITKKMETALGFIPVFNKFIKATISILGFLVILQEWGFNIGAIITGLGIGGVAIALAAKDTVANFFGSLMILFDAPFKIGDWIETPKVEGVVEDIGFRSTKIRTFAQALVSIPNSILANEAITNWSRMGKRRITFKIGVKYDTPENKLKKCIEKIRTILENHNDIHKQTIFVYLNEFADSSINIFLYFFTKTINWETYLKVREDVLFKIMEIMENEGVEFAFPSTSIYIEKYPSTSNFIKN